MLEQNYGQEFSKRLRALRLENNLTIEEFANMVGISKSSVGYYENQNRVPDIVVMGRIADTFNVSTDYLIGRSDARTKEPKLKSICDKTGLSDKSVLMLARLKKEKCSRLRIINLLLEQADDDIEDNYELDGRYEGSVLNAVCRYAGRYNSINEWEAEELFRDTVGLDNEALCIYDSPGYIPTHLYNAMYQIILNQATEAIKDFYDLVMSDLLMTNEFFPEEKPE